MTRTITLAMLLTLLAGCESEMRVTDAGETGGAAAGGTTSSTDGETGGAATAGAGATEGARCPTTRDEAMAQLGGTDYSPTWMLSEDQDPDCPASLPADATFCSSLSMTCAYRGINRYSFPGFGSCSCILASGSQQQWNCSSPEPTDANSCPTELPTTGDSCATWLGGSCEREGVQCWCEEAEDGSAAWDCGTAEERVAAMQAIDPTTPVSQLTPDERDTWCNWFVSASGVSPQVSPVSAAGCALNTGLSRGTKPFDNACVSWLGASQCEGNLALSACDAPLSALTDCIETIKANQPSPLGCAPYLDSAGCSGTIVIDGSLVPNNASLACSVQVE